MSGSELDRFGELFQALPPRMQHLGLIGQSKATLPAPLQRFVAFSAPGDHIRSHEGIASIPGSSRVHSVPKLSRLYPNCSWIIDDLQSASVVQLILLRFVAPIVLIRLSGAPADIVDTLTAAREMGFSSLKLARRHLLVKEKLMQAE